MTSVEGTAVVGASLGDAGALFPLFGLVGYGEAIEASAGEYGANSAINKHFFIHNVPIYYLVGYVGLCCLRCLCLSQRHRDGWGAEFIAYIFIF